MADTAPLYSCRPRSSSMAAVLVLLAARLLAAPAPIRLGAEHTFSGKDNRSCDICVHPSTGRPLVVWQTNDGHIKYSGYEGTAWSPPRQIPGADNVGARHQRFHNGAVAAAFDRGGTVHVVYATLAPRAGLYHVRRAAGGAWTEPALVHRAEQAELKWVQMAANPRGELFVSFEQGYRAMHCEYDGASWSKAAPLHARTSHVHHVCVGPDGEPRILFKAKLRGGYEAHLAVRKRKRWRAAQITRDGGHVDCPAGAVDASGRLHVLWSKVAEEGHDAALKYGVYRGDVVTGAVIARTNAHAFTRAVIDDAGATYVFLPRRYPPKVLVRAKPNGPWSAPVPLGPARQGYWFLEAAAHGNAVHVVYSNWYGPDRPKGVTYRKITRAPAGAATQPRRAGAGLAPDPANPRWLACGDRHVALSGNGIWVLIPDTDRDVVRHNAYAAAWGANTNRTSLFSGCDRVNGGELAPWLRTGPGKANDGGPKFDLTRFDPRYWARAAQYVRDAGERGIYPVIQIWCEPVLERGEGRWIVHPFNPDNNINDLSHLPRGSADAGRDSAFYNTRNRKLMRLQERFVTQALDELGRFAVIWDIGNEIGLDTKISDAWIRHWADFFDAYERSHPGVTVLATVDTNGDRGHFDRIAGLDVINVHGFADSNPFTLAGAPARSAEDSRVDVKAMQRTLSRLYARYRRPLINTRITADPDYAGRTLRDRPGNALETRHILWGYFFAGAHFISFRNPDATGACPKAWTDPPRTTERAQRALRAFISSFEFWKCRPRPTGIVASGDAVVLAEAKRTYAFYAPNGRRLADRFTADLSEAGGAALRARWFDPREGRFGKPSAVRAAARVAFRLPTGEDWALLLDRPADGRPPE